MNEFADMSRTYQGVRTALSSALNDLDGVTVTDERGNQHLADVRKTLTTMDANFNAEIEYLEKHADWQTFTVAFFGETNAGKSTIIESLRIIMDEQTRSSCLRDNAAQVKEREAQFAREAEGLIRDLHSGYENYEMQLADLATQIRNLATSSQRAIDAAKQDVMQAEQEALQSSQQVVEAQQEALQATQQVAESLKLAAKRLWFGLSIGLAMGAACGAAMGAWLL
jgi:tRNA U34 5-carboxymethylaminomethyl modifying GTPase MnmE/TrmE